MVLDHVADDAEVHVLVEVDDHVSQARTSSAIRSGRARVRSSRTQVSMKASFLATSSGSVNGGVL